MPHSLPRSTLQTAGQVTDVRYLLAANRAPMALS